MQLPPATELKQVRELARSCCRRYPNRRFIVALYPLATAYVLWTEEEWRRLPDGEKKRRNPLEWWKNEERHLFEEA